VAEAWQLLLALKRADRALWKGEKEPFTQTRQRWPERASLSPEEVRHWAAYRLPHDPTAPAVHD